MALFQRKIEPHCGYCAHGRDLGEGQVACPKKGVMSAGSHCRAFRYDPLKRVPEPHIFTALPCLEEGDYSL